MIKMKNPVTLEQVLDLIDLNRDEQEAVILFEGHCEEPNHVHLNSAMLKSIEDKLVNSIAADHNEIVIWLEDE